MPVEEKLRVPLDTEKESVCWRFDCLHNTIGGQGAELLSQQLVVPAGIQGKPIVREDVGTPLGRRQVRQLDDRHLLEAETLGRYKAPVAGEDSRLGELF